MAGEYEEIIELGNHLVVLWECSQNVVTGWHVSYNKEWMLTWIVLGKQPFGRLNQREMKGYLTLSIRLF